MFRSIPFLLVLWAAKSGAFYLAFRFRQVEATIFDCLLIAAAPMLSIVFAMFIPPPIASNIIYLMLAIGLTSYVTIKCTSVSFLPDGLLIPLVVEIVYQAVLWVLGMSTLFPS